MTTLPDRDNESNARALDEINSYLAGKMICELTDAEIDRLVQGIESTKATGQGPSPVQPKERNAQSRPDRERDDAKTSEIASQSGA